jgi:ABC-type Zn uptake system ZnuABC Zn-binding protein ZnuA
MAAQLTTAIARALAEALPAAAPALLANGQAYSQQLLHLSEQMAEKGKELANNRIVTQHGVFDYLARDMGLEVVAVVQAHAGQNPSAAEILALVDTIKAHKAGAIFTEPQYPEAIGRTIARDAGIVAARLDPAANGPDQAPLDYYEQVMRSNLTILEQTLGRR